VKHVVQKTNVTQCISVNQRALLVSDTEGELVCDEWVSLLAFYVQASLLYVLRENYQDRLNAVNLKLVIDCLVMLIVYIILLQIACRGFSEWIMAR